MKKALLLHGTDGNSESNWLPWLKGELESAGWQVWTPDLPRADEPHIGRYNEHIFAKEDWAFDDETIVVGHSSGSLATLGILQALPESVRIREAILIGSFKNDLGWPSLGGLFEVPYDYNKIRQHANQFTLFHSNDDPYCPLDHAEYLAEQLDGELHIQPGQKHFSTETDQKYTTFPLLKKWMLDQG